MKRLVKKGMIFITGMLILVAPFVASAANGASPVTPKGTSLHPVKQMAAPGPKTRTKAMSPKAGGVNATDIRDIRGPIHIPDPMKWIYLGMGGLLVVVMAALAWYFLRKRRHDHSKSAADVAFETLIRAKSLMQPEQARAFSVLVSGAVRTYIECRYPIKATRHTTQEFMAQLKKNPPAALGEHTALLHGFLSYCDLAKFARCALSVDQMKDMHQHAWEFVETTAPRLQEEAQSKRELRKKDSMRVSLFGKLTSLAQRITHLRHRMRKDRDISTSLPMAGTAATGGR